MKSVIEAKKKYNNIYWLKYDDGSIFIFRTLLWGEFKNYRALLSAFPAMATDIKDAIFQDCLIEGHIELGSYYMGAEVNLSDLNDIKITFDELYSVIDAGVIDTIVNYIIRTSGISSLDELINDIEQLRYRELYNAEGQLLSAVSSMFKVKRSDYDSMNWEDIVALIVNTEQLLGKEFEFAQPKTDNNFFEQDNKHLNES